MHSNPFQLSAKFLILAFATQLAYCHWTDDTKNYIMVTLFVILTETTNKQSPAPEAPVAPTTSTSANTGSLDWVRQSGVAGASTYGNGVASDSAGNLYVTGYTDGSLDGQIKTTAGVNELFLTKYDSSGNKLWTKLLGSSSGGTMAYAIATDSSNNVYITGTTSGSLDGQTWSGSMDLFLVKYDSTGSKLWTRQLGNGNTTDARGIAIDGFGNPYVTGYTFSSLDGQTLTGVSDLYVVKYNSSGSKQWTKLLGVASKSVNSTAITSDSPGNVYVSGFTNGAVDGAVTGLNDSLVVKFNSSGTKQWARQLGVSGKNTYGYGVAIDASGNVYTTGSTYGSLDGNSLTGFADLFLIKYDTSGNKQWTKLLGIGSNKNTEGRAVISDSAGILHITGYTSGNLDGQTLAGIQDLIAVKYDASGNKQWTKLLGASTKQTNGHGIASDSSGNVYATGITTGSLSDQTVSGTQDSVAVKLK